LFSTLQQNVEKDFRVWDDKICAFVGLAYQCKDIVFRFIIEYSNYCV
jgi:hypothetical protein